MELMWIKASGSYRLVLHLGDYNGKFIALDARKISDSEVSAIRSSILKLKDLPLQDRLLYLKKVCPNAMKNAFRTFHIASVNVQDTMDIKQ